MLAEAIDRILQEDEATRMNFINLIATHPEIVMAELATILTLRQSQRWIMAVRIFEAIGYPANSSAIPAMVSHLEDPNQSTYYTAREIIRKLPPPSVIPHMIAILWDKGGRNLSWYFNDIQSLSSVINSYGYEYARACCPVLVMLMARYGSQLELEPMLWVIETIRPEESLYAIPVLIEIAQTRYDPDVYTLAQQLLQRYPPEALAIYVGVRNG